jgi:hypothetical protein
MSLEREMMINHRILLPERARGGAGLYRIQSGPGREFRAAIRDMATVPQDLFRRMGMLSSAAPFVSKASWQINDSLTENLPLRGVVLTPSFVQVPTYQLLDHTEGTKKPDVTMFLLANEREMDILRQLGEEDVHIIGREATIERAMDALVRSFSFVYTTASSEQSGGHVMHRTWIRDPHEPSFFVPQALQQTQIPIPAMQPTYPVAAYQ